MEALPARCTISFMPYALGVVPLKDFESLGAGLEAWIVVHHIRWQVSSYFSSAGFLFLLVLLRGRVRTSEDC